MSTNAWRVLFGAIGAVVAFLLVQTDLPLDPIVRVTLGAISVVLAVINPDRNGTA